MILAITTSFSWLYTPTLLAQVWRDRGAAAADQDPAVRADRYRTGRRAPRQPPSGAPGQAPVSHTWSSTATVGDAERLTLMTGWCPHVVVYRRLACHLAPSRSFPAFQVGNDRLCAAPASDRRGGLADHACSAGDQDRLAGRELPVVDYRLPGRVIRSADGGGFGPRQALRLAGQPRLGKGDEPRVRHRSRHAQRWRAAPHFL